MARSLLVLAFLSVAVAAAVAESPPGLGGPVLTEVPTQERVLVQGELQGLATSVATEEAFAVSVEYTGIALRAADGQREHGTVEAVVRFLDTAGQEPLRTLAATLAYEAERSPTGPEGWTVALQGEGPHGLRLTLVGDLTGVELGEGAGWHALSARGALVLEEGAHRAEHFQLDALGHATSEQL